MDAEEQDAFDALPDPVSVFRGYTLEGRERGLSWTTDRSVAECFAHRFADIEEGAHPRIAAGTTPKVKVIAHFLERNESEIVVLPENVRIIKIESLQKFALARRADSR